MKERVTSRYYLVFCGLFLVLLSGIAMSQQMRGRAVEGYITSVHLPEGFEVNGQRVMLQPGTTYGLEKDRNTVTDSPLRSDLQVGAYVFVLGSVDGNTKIAEAATVLFRDDWSRKLTGVGPVDKIVSSGPEAEVQADGYSIRIPGSTQAVFHGELKSMADVGTSTWLHYEGKRGRNGIVVASKADFFNVKIKPAKVVHGVEDVKLKFEAPDLAAHMDGRVMLGVVGTWYPIPADTALQERIARIGMSLVPASQRDLPDGDPLKIKFEFFAFDDKKTRDIVCSGRGGVILVPKAALERMQNDNQVASLLANGVAVVLQRKGMSSVMQQRRIIGDELGTLAAYSLLPIPASLGLDLAGALPDKKVARLILEQRERVALALMANAGYDPWQAPEALRLLRPKELPQDMDSLKYPDTAGYMLGILNLQYRGDTNRQVSAGPAS